MNTFCSEMALFTVTRYLGEDEQKSVGKDISADDILKKIKSEAKARKKSREKYCNDLPETTVRNATDKDTTVDKLSKNKVEIQDKPEKKEKSEKKKRLIDLDAAEDHHESDEAQEKDSNNFTKVKVKKKKRKAGEQISDEEDVEVSSKKKKRKREKIHYETLDNEESGPIATSEISPVEPIEGQEKNESQNDKKKRKKLHIDGPTDLGGFTVLGSHKPVQLPKVTRVLPDWLSHPTEISRDLTENQLPVSDMPGLCENLVDKLQKNGITHFFPVQQQVIPALLSSSRCGFHIGPAGYRPSDICVSAPTGSGKTLAFGIPIIHYILLAKHKGSNMDGKIKAGKVTGHTKDDESELDSEDNFEDTSQKSESDVEEFADSLEDLVGKTHDKGINDILESDTNGDENDDDDENEESDIDQDDGDVPDDESDDDQTIEDRTEGDIENEVHSDDDQEASDGESSDDGEFRHLPENELGCVRVVKDVDFSWIEKENEEARRNMKTHPFALILEPTRELAIQVKNHLTAVAKHTDIKIATVVGGMSVQKQRRVLKRCPDVLVATPGRLWDLLQEGVPYLSEIEKTGHLVIDEADRMVEKGHFEELASLLRRMNSNPKIASKRHTYVFSATLTTVHEGPQRTNKRKKNKIVQTTEAQKLELLMQSIGLKAKPKVVDLTRKVGTVETLTEARIHCSNEEKDIYLYYFLKQYPGRTLVFCNSKDCIRRLVSIFNYLKCSPLPLHADMHQRQRLKNLDKFTANPRGLLIASDVAARGLDIPNVQHVIHFQVPNIVENYIHRSGRTARASKEGLSIVLIGPNDMKNYKKIINTLNRDEDLPLFPVEPDYLSEVKQRVDLVRKIETQEYRFQKGKRQNDWFKKMADESGIDIEDEGILADIGDERKQAEHKRSMKFLKTELDMLLKQPIVPLVNGGKYPTKSGKLEIPVNKSETGGALAHLKTDKKKQGKILKKLQKKPTAEQPLKRKKDKWRKKKQKRMMAKMN